MTEQLGFDFGQDNNKKERGLFGRGRDLAKKGLSGLKESYVETQVKMNLGNPGVAEKKGLSGLWAKVKCLFTQTKVARDAQERLEDIKENKATLDKIAKLNASLGDDERLFDNGRGERAIEGLNNRENELMNQYNEAKVGVGEKLLFVGGKAVENTVIMSGKTADKTMNALKTVASLKDRIPGKESLQKFKDLFKREKVRPTGVSFFEKRMDKFQLKSIEKRIGSLNIEKELRESWIKSIEPHKAAKISDLQKAKDAGDKFTEKMIQDTINMLDSKINEKNQQLIKIREEISQLEAEKIDYNAKIEACNLISKQEPQEKEQLAGA